MEVISFAPEFEAMIKQKQKEDCEQAYMKMIKAMSKMPVEFLIASAFQAVAKKEIDSAIANAYIQALSLVDKDLAREINDIIESGECPENTED